MDVSVDQLIDLLSELISLRPVTEDAAQVNAAVGHLAGFLDRAGVFTREYAHGGRNVLYAATHESDTVDFLLNAHLDVVPAEDAMFAMTEREGCLCGRGTVDCLGNAALIAGLLAELNGQASVGAIFSTDEETGGETTAFMASQPIRARKLILVLDGGTLTVAQKGVLTVKLRAPGKACHAAEPWKGDNALDRLLDGYAAVRTLFTQAREHDQWHDTLVATRCQAGTVANRVPDSAEMTLNIRFTTVGDDQRILRTLRERSGLEVEPQMQCSPVVIDPDHPEIRRLQANLAASLGRDIPLERLNGATDARHFAEHDAPVVIMGLPGRGAHSSDEAVQKAQFPLYLNALRKHLTDA